MLSSNNAPDSLSEWIEPPPAARASGDAEPIRVFETAEAALRFLANVKNGRAQSGRVA
jgi:hypothetical protein